jgi:hypothetical protein
MFQEKERAGSKEEKKMREQSYSMTKMQGDRRKKMMMRIQRWEGM